MAYFSAVKSLAESLSLSEFGRRSKCRWISLKSHKLPLDSLVTVALRTSVTVVGVAVAIIGIVSTPFNLAAGIAVLIIGIIIAGAGAATGRRADEEPIPVRVPGGQRVQHTMSGGMSMEGGSMDDMVRMLATVSEDQRKTMMKGRIQMFLSMPEEQRQLAIRGMLTALNKLPSDQKKHMIRTRTEIIGELAEDQRRTIMKSRMATMRNLREIDMADMQAVEQVMMEVPEGPRMAFMRTMKELKESMPMM